MVTEGISLICLGSIISARRRNGTTANSRDRCSYERRGLIVVRIDLPLAIEPVSPRPSRLANMKHCRICLSLF